MRRRRAPKRKIDPDPRYNDLLIAKFINIVMECGKKSIRMSPPLTITKEQADAAADIFIAVCNEAVA